MKENSGIIHSILFNQIEIAYPKQRQKNRLTDRVQKLFHTYRESISTCLAIIGVGAVMLAASYFFFIQLAEHGW